MKIDIYEDLKRAFKDGLSEWFKENNTLIEGIHSKNDEGENLLTIKQFCKKHPFISEGGMRFKLFSREWNGLGKCIAQGTRRVLIKEKEALEWFANPPPEANWTYDKNRYPDAR